MTYTLGIDLGTSGVKAGLLNLDTLKLESVSIRDYDDSPEQDPDLLWNQALEAVRGSLHGSGKPVQVRAIGLSGQMHGAVLFDDRGKLIGPITNWKDQKWSTEAVVEKLKLSISDSVSDQLGADISSGYTGAILLGMKENDAYLFQRIAHFVLPVDYLRGKLLDENTYATDPTNASGTGLFNTQFNCWHTELISKLHLPMDIFPEVHETAQIAGVISDQFSREVGLEPGCPVIFGGGDNQMSMLGSGLIGPDSPMLINIGTAAQISRVSSIFQRHPGIDTRRYFQGSYAFVGASLAGGGSYRGLREAIRKSEKPDINYPQMDALAYAVPPGADGLVFCSGPTRQNLNRRPGFSGNTSRIGSIGHRARAVMEGILMDLFDPYETLGQEQRCNFIAGAGKSLQKSRVWSQISADILGKPLRLTDFENAVFGAALSAAVGIGVFPRLGEPVRSITFSAQTLPEPANVKFYRDEFVPYWRTQVGVN